MANINIKGINVANLSDEQKNAIAQALGVNVDDLKIVTPKKKEVNHLQMKEGSETIAIDRFSGEEFDITTLSEEELTNAKKTGLSPESFAKYQEGEAIRASIKNLTGNSRGPRTGISAAQQVKDILNGYSNKVNESIMTILTDPVQSKNTMGLRYPLFLEIPTGASAEQKKEMRKDGKNNRFGSYEYTFEQLPGRQFFMTNDIYSRNIDKIITTFKNLFDTVEEVVENAEEAPKAKKSRKSKKNA